MALPSKDIVPYLLLRSAQTTEKTFIEMSNLSVSKVQRKTKNDP
jgi:hypothetical protein